MIRRIKAIAGQKAIGQTQGHGGVVGSLPWGKAELAAAHHVRKGIEAPQGHKLPRRANGVAARKTKKTALRPPKPIGHRSAPLGTRSYPEYFEATA